MDECRSQWLAEASSRCVVPGHLAKIVDRVWVVQQCLAHTTDEYSRQQGLLQYGLQVTAQHCNKDHLTACAQGEFYHSAMLCQYCRQQCHTAVTILKPPSPPPPPSWPPLSLTASTLPVLAPCTTSRISLCTNVAVLPAVASGKVAQEATNNVVCTPQCCTATANRDASWLQVLSLGSHHSIGPPPSSVHP